MPNINDIGSWTQEQIDSLVLPCSGDMNENEVTTLGGGGRRCMWMMIWIFLRVSDIYTVFQYYSVVLVLESHFI